jgi:hypothetical protein
VVALVVVVPVAAEEAADGDESPGGRGRGRSR